MQPIERKYGRDDVDYATFYTGWMKRLAQWHTLDELRVMAGHTESAASNAAKSHMSAVQKTGSMQGNSSARARTRMSLEGASERAFALSGAIEIHELFPEFAKPTNQGAAK